MEISKLIIPAMEQSSHFLPLTKSYSPAMLPLQEKPALHYVVQEGVASNFKNFSIVTHKSDALIGSYFGNNNELKDFLKKSNKDMLLDELDRIIKHAEFSYMHQEEPLGVGHALWLARHGMGKEYFGVALPHDIIISKIPAMDQIVRVARQEKASIIAVQELPGECLSNYGVIAIKKQLSQSLMHVSHIVHKPDQKTMPSTFAVVGRYVLSHKIFGSIEEMITHSVGEQLELHDVINTMIYKGEKVLAYKMQGVRYDIRTPIGWTKAVIGMALQSPFYAPHIQRFLDELGTSHSFLYNAHKTVEHIY